LTISKDPFPVAQIACRRDSGGILFSFLSPSVGAEQLEQSIAEIHQE
jgi:hypothetical protein